MMLLFGLLMLAASSVQAMYKISMGGERCSSAHHVLSVYSAIFVAAFAYLHPLEDIISPFSTPGFLLSTLGCISNLLVLTLRSVEVKN